MTVPFNDRITKEKFYQRAFAAATVTVSKIVNDVTRSVKVTALNSHLTAWWYPEEVKIKINYKVFTIQVYFIRIYSVL